MSNKHEEVVMKFNQAAQAYDNQRRALIPCFDDFYNTAVSIANSDSENPHILDLGAGTGLMSSFMLARYPNAHLTLIDISDKMLELAKMRFADRGNVRYIVDDYTNYVAENQFDLIVSALSIHHLADPDKRKVYQNAFHSLRPGGIFVNCDQVLGSSSFLDTMYKMDWRKKVEASGLQREAIEAAYERTKLDQMSTLELQLGWLKEIGFADVDCVYKYFNFTVLFGRKLA